MTPSDTLNIFLGGFVCCLGLFTIYHFANFINEVYKSKTFKPSVIEYSGGYFKRFNEGLKEPFPTYIDYKWLAQGFTDYDTAKTFLHLVKKFHKNAKLVPIG